VTARQTITGRDPATGITLAVGIEDGRIADITRPSEPAEAYIASGLVDLQVNGFGGIDLNTGTVTAQTVIALCERMALEGVTTFLPTIITASEPSILAALAAIAEARRIDPLAAHMIVGIHVEGPSISPVDGPRGAHPLEHVRAPALAEFERWQAACNGLVSMVTLSPEYPEAIAYIAELTRRGVHIAIGHTAATPEQIHAAAQAGAVLSTHLGNGAAASLPRHPNFIWAQLADDRLSATFIADGHHLPADTFKVMLRAKSLARSVLVSDTVALAGLPPGIYEQQVGGRVEVTAEGRVGIAGTPYLAGAGLPLNANVAIAIDLAGLSLAEALRLATVNPGRFASDRGLMQVGQPADLITFDWQPGARRLALREVWVAGQRKSA